MQKSKTEDPDQTQAIALAILDEIDEVGQSIATHERRIRKLEKTVAKILATLGENDE